MERGWMEWNYMRFCGNKQIHSNRRRVAYLNQRNGIQLVVVITLGDNFQRVILLLVLVALFPHVVEVDNPVPHHTLARAKAQNVLLVQSCLFEAGARALDVVAVRGIRAPAHVKSKIPGAGQGVDVGVGGPYSGQVKRSIVAGLLENAFLKGNGD